jgi:hypothetical protein
VKQLSSDELHEAIHRALQEVDRRLATGELDGSGRFYTDEELAAGAATGRSTPRQQSKSDSKAEDPAA